MIDHPVLLEYEVQFRRASDLAEADREALVQETMAAQTSPHRVNPLVALRGFLGRVSPQPTRSR